MRSKGIILAMAIAAVAFGAAPDAQATTRSVDDAVGNCAWAADTGCYFTADGGTSQAVVVSPTMPTLSGASAAWTAVPVPGTGTTVWTAQFGAPSGTLVALSAADNTSGVVLTQASAPLLEGVVNATVTLTPGIPGPTTGTVANSVSAIGTFTGFTPAGVGSCAFTFTGSGADSTALGSGSGIMQCTGATFTSTCVLNYERTGVSVVFEGFGGNVGTMAGTGLVVPTNLNPTTKLTLVAALVAA